MTPLKVNRTLPLCLRRNLLLHGLNRPAVSTLSSLAAAARSPTVTGRRGTEGPFVHQPRIDLCCEVCTWSKRVFPVSGHLCPRMVCAWSIPPALSYGPGSMGAQDGQWKAQGSGPLSVPGEMPHGA